MTIILSNMICYVLYHSVLSIECSTVYTLYMYLGGYAGFFIELFVERLLSPCFCGCLGLFIGLFVDQLFYTNWKNMFGITRGIPS